MGSTWYTHRMLAEAWSTLGVVDRYRLGSETRGLGLSESFGNGMPAAIEIGGPCL